MANESGIKIENRRSPLQKELKIDIKSLLVALGKGAVNVGFLQWDDLAENGVELLESLGLETKPEEIAGLLIVRSLMQAIANLVKEYEASLIAKPENYKYFSEQLTSAIANQELILNSDFFEHPEHLPLVSEIQTALATWLQDFVEKPIDAERISASFPVYFVEALNEEWLTRNEEYIVIQERLDTPFTQANKRQQQWLRYRAWLQKQIEEPMFAEAFGLKQVYVPLRAYYEEKIERSENEGIERDHDRDKKRIAVKLQESLEKWLQAAEKEDAIRLLTGGPGSGKSSFGKIFAARRAAKGDIPTLFIPLHKFSHGDDLVKAIGEFAQTNCFLSHNPIERDNEDLRLLIIFDGLDELSMQGKIAENAAKDFVEAVRFLVTQFNSYKARLQVIISGREVVIQANRKQRSPHQLLYLLPYFLKDYEQKKYIDEENILQEDQRQNWWINYGKAKGKNYDGLPGELDQENLVDITTQPLLNYLIALSFERDILQFTADTNLNEIYGDLLEAVYERGYEKHGHRRLEGISLEEFIGILEEIALSCWHGNGRTTTVREIETHCSKSGLNQILVRFQNSFEQDSSACITRLLAAFYFRESGGIRDQEKTFEFTHKSFGEYLTAKRIVEEVRYIYEDLEARKKNFRKGCDEIDALVSWAELCGPSAMSKYLFNFVWDEIELIYAEKPELVRNWKIMLCRLIEVMLVNGMPMEKLDPRPNYQEEKRQARNAEESLLATLNACARTTKELSQINWHSREVFGEWIASLQAQRIGIKNTLAFQCLSFLNLENCILYMRDFYGANFKDSYLTKSTLTYANLVGAHLEGAHLEGASFRVAILIKANLRGANLEGANLREANLEGANLEGANLEGAHLEGANLRETILEGKDIAEITRVRD
ncbi:MAG: pentapeptide repeat-containing protein [Cyanobacteria bacterium P01_F01_bin.143]